MVIFFRLFVLCLPFVKYNSLNGVVPIEFCQYSSSRYHRDTLSTINIIHILSYHRISSFEPLNLYFKLKSFRRFCFVLYISIALHKIHLLSSISSRALVRIQQIKVKAMEREIRNEGKPNQDQHILLLDLMYKERDGT